MKGIYKYPYGYRSTRPVSLRDFRPNIRVRRTEKDLRRRSTDSQADAIKQEK